MESGLGGGGGLSSLVESVVRRVLSVRPHVKTEAVLAQMGGGSVGDALLLKRSFGALGDASRLAGGLLVLLRVLRAVESGVASPYQEDVKGWLATVARTIRVEAIEPSREYLERINPDTLEYAVAAIVRGPVSGRVPGGLVSRAVGVARRELGGWRGSPYPEVVARVWEKVEENLRESAGLSWYFSDARRAALLVRSALVFLPILAVEEEAELGMAKTLISWGYNVDDYDLPLLVYPLWKLSRLLEEGVGVRLAASAVRQACRVEEAVKHAVWRTLAAGREAGSPEDSWTGEYMIENVLSVLDPL